MTERFSIVVLSLNHLESTQRLLESLSSTQGYFETLLLDNGSVPEVVSNLQAIEKSELGRRLNLRCTFNPVNVGIASGRNQGANRASGEFLVFLDNDVEIIRPDWLEQIAAVYRAKPGLGTVGGVLLNIDRTIQFAGGSIDARAHVTFRTDLVPGQSATQSMFCLGACLSTPISCFRQLGGFDKQFDPMDYEDIDYCLRATQAGWPSYICQSCILVHEQHTTTRTGVAGFTRLKHYLRSGSRFLKRWQSSLSEGCLEIV
jgi:GT2 family glycosyltransferase